MKAVGQGLSLMDSPRDLPLPVEPGVFLDSKNAQNMAVRWSLLELHPGKMYAAALAVKGRGFRLKCMLGGKNICMETGECDMTSPNQHHERRITQGPQRAPIS